MDRSQHGKKSNIACYWQVLNHTVHYSLLHMSLCTFMCFSWLLCSNQKSLFRLFLCYVGYLLMFTQIGTEYNAEVQAPNICHSKQQNAEWAYCVFACILLLYLGACMCVSLCFLIPIRGCVGCFFALGDVLEALVGGPQLLYGKYWVAMLRRLITQYSIITSAGNAFLYYG